MPQFIEIGDDLVEIGGEECSVLVDLEQVYLVTCSRKPSRGPEVVIHFKNGHQHALAGCLADLFLAKLREAHQLPAGPAVPPLRISGT